MQLVDDDEVYEVDQDYLGPPGRYIGRFKYRSLLIFPVLFLLALIVSIQLGAGIGLFSLAWTALLAGWLTRQVIARVTYERPLGALLATFAHELTAAREPRRREGRALVRPMVVRRLAAGARAEGTP